MLPPHPSHSHTDTDPQPSANIWHSPDGVYRWTYEFDMLRNPSIFITVVKVMGLSCGIVYLVAVIVGLIGRDIASWVDLWETTRMYLIIAGVVLVMTVIGYLIVAAMYGWKYQVMFEMTDEYVRHIQMPKQFTKAEALGLLTTLAGAAAGKPFMAGLGTSVATKQTSTSEFSKVTNVKVRRRRHTIYVNQLLEKNQVYVEDADFEFVKEFIASRCVNAKKIHT